MSNLSLNGDVSDTTDTVNLISNEASTSNATQFNSNLQEPEEDDSTGSHGVRRRKPTETFERGSLNVLSAKYESLDYDTCENNLLLDEERKRGYPFIVWKDISRWIVFLMIGVITALIAFIIDICIEEFSNIKYTQLKKSVDKYVLLDKLYIPYLLWVLTNICIVFIGSVLVAYVEPVAAGSGIPQVKCYLNGVKVPRVVRIKTLIVKTVGVITAVVGGLAGGKEGPMIHSGAVVAAGISQGKSTTFNKDFKVFEYFREDHEKRDFVSGGAAAGVSAAFGAPIGGVLFSLEEGTSFWNQALTWRTFFATVVSTFTLNFALSAYHGHPGELSYPGLLNLGKMEPFPFEFYELPVFMLFGVVGGALGALWNYINYRLSVFRLRYVRSRWLRVAEACLVAGASATCGFLMMFLLNDCRPLGEDPTKVPLQLYCADGEYNALAALWFQTPEASVRSLLHDPLGSYRPTSLLVFVLAYFLLSTWTFGLAVSSGLFIPNLLTGAAWGRLLAILIQYTLPSNSINPAKYALIGAAAQLGGVVRMTISLAVIIIETTGQISNALPIIVTLVVAKWTGDFFNEGIYDIHIQLAGVPLLGWEAPPLAHTVYASQVMSHPAVILRTVERVGDLVTILQMFTHNGFPVVDPTSEDDESEVPKYKRLRGLILRSQLIVLLQNKVFNENPNIDWSDVNINMFRKEYPRYPDVMEVFKDMSGADLENTIDLRPYMNPSPYTLPHRASLPRLFRLFRALGLRHLPIVNDVNEVVGMVTRKDIARYRVWRHHGYMGMQELLMCADI
ncbi:H(+)/Cl(-) exchange transporter 7 [Aricia agestis]|uniref:H(+)/Cl(-) exchange transporter 7 n=1 Tax=Aricia agestis TaxID=91739 RepID=UPI001C2027AF|nr:H(+)/Cl(-) exchange transporter 7 [Aricia agestis]XP_041977946.1 H(+)/Cl(-) exchange transporter 7 [Aricia agestis]